MLLDHLRPIDRLKDECLRPAWANGIMPHPAQSLPLVRALIEHAFDRDSPDALLGSSETVIVVVADGVSFDVAARCWSAPTFFALTSTFPSTTSSALLSATTGLTPAQHGVVGVAFYVAEIDAVFDCYADATIGTDAGAAPPHQQFDLGPWTTVFTGLARDVDCVAHIGGLATTPGRWTRALVTGARVVAPSVDWNLIQDDPIAMVTAAAAEIDATLSNRTPSLAWAHVNIDAAVHTRGYDDAVHEAVRSLGRTAERWASDGHTVIVHSDHGLVPIVGSERAQRLLSLLQDPAYCAHGPGGAGRTLWAYPRPGCQRELAARARELAEGFASVIDRDELFRCGAIADTALARERIGEVVTVATGAEFPRFSPRYCYEHGGFSEEEMLAPVAIWAGR